ncbi:MAG: tetratricopeptide repeat protein [Planctomycetes bacterium]|nr:tetratricopeptide repeat protein [Planctomycetota bacterium]
MTVPDPQTISQHVQWLLQWADDLVRTRKWTEADSVFQSAVKSDRTPTSLIAHASALAEQERFHESICQLTKAIDIAVPMGDRKGLSTIYHNLASIYREIGDTKLARRFQQHAVSMTDECGSEELLGLANDAWLARRMDLAECLAGTAADIDDEDDIPSLEAATTAGLMSSILRDPREGIKPLLRSLSRHRVLGEWRLMGIDFLNLSVLFGELGRHRGEMALVRRAIRCFDHAPAPLSSVKAHRLLAHLERLHRLRKCDPCLN